MSDDLVKSALRMAVRRLASVCDGAQEEDGCGFNSSDTAWGKRLASLPDELWVDSDFAEASNRCAKYVRQIGEVPKFHLESGSDSGRVVTSDGTSLVIRFPYNAEIVSAVRTIPARWFDGGIRGWRVPFSQHAAVFAFAESNGFSISESARNSSVNAPIAVVTDVEISPRVASMHNGDIIIEFPYDGALVAAVKQLQGRVFRKNPPSWKAPATLENIEMVEKIVETYGLTMDESLSSYISTMRTTAESNLKQSSALDGDLKVDGLAFDLMPFQRAGVAYAIANPKSINGDKMGLGKTAQAIATATATNSFPAVAICPAHLKLNWVREINKWTPGKRTYVLNGMANEVLPEADWYIVNYNLLAAQIEYDEDGNPKLDARRKKVRRPARTTDIRAIDYKFIAVDEAHYAKNSKSERSKAVAELVKASPRVLWMTGTPVENRPSELIHAITCLGHMKTFGGWESFVKSYCGAYRDRFGWKIKGATNLPELASRLRATCFIQRTKKEVLPELPEKQRSVVPLDISNRNEYVRAETALVQYVSERAALDKDFLESLEGLDDDEIEAAKDERAQDAATRAEKAKHLVLLANLKRIAALGKLNGAIEWMSDFLDTGEKLIVFAHHIEVQNYLYDALSKHGDDNGYRVVRMDPDDTKEMQQARVDVFQNDPTVLAIVCSLSAHAEGWTGTASSNVVFMEMAWSPGKHDQAEDRCYGRLNDPHGANAWYLVGNKTVDEDSWQMLEDKRAIAEGATGRSGVAAMLRAVQKRRKTA